MAKRKMVQCNLLKNSIAAYFAAIEIHNKPNIPYRYETVSLLLMNAWELLLKSYIRKHLKKKNIFEKNGHTITFDKAMNYVNENIGKNFFAVKKNLEVIEDYRNNITHFYSEDTDPYIFMLIAKCALNYVEFVKKYFNKDIMDKENLYIMPLGFKLPFNPEDFLSNKTNESSTKETKQFIEEIIKAVKELKEKNIEDSIVLGFDVNFQSVKKVKNIDIIVAIDKNAEMNIDTPKKMQLSNDPNAQKIQLSDDAMLEKFPLNYKSLCEKCKKEILNFKQGKRFNLIMKELKKDENLAYIRKLNPNNKKSSKTTFYNNSIIDKIKELYFKE